MENQRGTGLLAFLAGVAAGAALGILFAPRSGRETRETIAGLGRKAKDRFGDTMDEARREWSDMKGKAHDAASMTQEEVEDFVRFLFEEGRDLADRMSGDVKRSGENVADEARKHTS